jgi:hypothetical protein
MTRAGTVTLDVEIIQQWLDWLDSDDTDPLRRDLIEVLQSKDPDEIETALRRAAADYLAGTD